MKKITNFFILLFAFVGFTSQIYSQAIPGPCNTDGSFAANTTYGLKIYNFTTSHTAILNSMVKLEPYFFTNNGNVQ